MFYHFNMPEKVLDDVKAAAPPDIHELWQMFNSETKLMLGYYTTVLRKIIVENF